MLGKKFFTVFLLFMIMILCIGFASAEELPNQTLNDTALNEDFKESSLPSIIENANENDTIDLNGNDEVFNIIEIDKSITLNGTDNNTKIFYSTFNINSGDVHFKNIYFKYDMDVYIINAKNNRLTLTNCTFDTSPIYFSGNSLTITNCTFKNRDASLTTNGAHVEIINCTFENIKRPAFFASNGEVTISDCMFLNSHSSFFMDRNKLCIIRNNKFKNSTYSSDLQENAKIIFEDNELLLDSVKIENSADITFKNNLLTNSSLVESSEMDIEGCDFVSSYLYTSKCRSIRNCSFSDFKSDFAECMFTSTMKVDGCTFTNNTCKYFFNTDKNISISNSLFTNNTADVLLFMGHAGQMTISASRFIENTLNNLVDCREGNSISVTDCEFSHNIAKNIIYLLEMKNIKITRNVFNNNTCQNSISISYLDTHMDYNEKITTSFEITNNAFMKSGKVHLNPKIASNIYKSKWGTSFTINNNFYGCNIENKDEFALLQPIEFESVTLEKEIKWVNVELSKNNTEYTLRFIDNEKNMMSLPDESLSIVDRATGDTLVKDIMVKSGKATFKSDEDLSNIYIINSAAQIINKPKASLTYNTSGNSYKDFKICVILSDNGKMLEGQNIRYETIPHGKSVSVSSEGYQFEKTDNEGKITITYFPTTLETYITDYDINLVFANENYSLTKLSIKKVKIDLLNCTLTNRDLTIQYGNYASGSRNVKLNEIRVLGDDKKLITDVQVDYFIYNGKKLVYESTLTLETSGTYLWSPPIARLGVGTYKVVIKSVYGKYNAVQKTATLKIIKAKTTISAPRVSAKYRQSKYFRITVKSNKNPVRNLYLKVKAYTGKTYRVYTVKTNSKGTALLNTRALKAGSHRVLISSGNTNYYVSAKSSITIRR